MQVDYQWGIADIASFCAPKFLETLLLPLPGYASGLRSHSSILGLVASSWNGKWTPLKNILKGESNTFVIGTISYSYSCAICMTTIVN